MVGVENYHSIAGPRVCDMHMAFGGTDTRACGLLLIALSLYHEWCVGVIIKCGHVTF